jgi:hypothetical protein
MRIGTTVAAGADWFEITGISFEALNLKPCGLRLDYG